VQSERASYAPWRLLVSGTVLVLIGVVGLTATIAAIKADRLGTVPLGGAFVAAAAAIVGTIVMTSALLLVTLGGEELG
jgi:hypothetical protein